MQISQNGHCSLSSEVRTPVGFSARPALVGFLSCAFGIATAKISGAHSLIDVFLAVLVFIVCGVAGLLLNKRSRLWSYLLGICCTASLGFLLFGVQEYRFDNSTINHIATVYSGEAAIFGTVISNPETSPSSVSFFLETDSLNCNSFDFFTQGKISVTISNLEKGGASFLPKIGERIKLYGELEPIESAKNPYEISYSMNLKEKGIRARAYFRSPFDLYIIDSIQRLTVSQRVGLFFHDLFIRSKTIIAKSIDDSLTKGFVNAVVLGDKTGITPETLDDFQRAGLTHLLVVSGFNVSIVALLVYYLLRLIGLVYRRLRIALSMATVLFYCLVVGLEPSVVRALIVIEFIFIARLFERKPDIGNLTAAAALVTLLLHPYDLFDIGFQLSYGAVFSLVFLYPSFERLFIPEQIKEGKTFLLEFAHRSLQGFFGSLSVFLGLLPVFLYHFHRVSIVGLAVNILGIPLAAIITIFGFLLVPLSLISSWLASVYGEALLSMTKIIAGIAHFSGSFEWSVIQLPRPQTILIIFYLAAIFYIIKANARNSFLGRSLIVFSVVFVLSVIKIPFANSILKNNNNVSLLFFDVGQGDAMLLSAPNGKTYLIDFGGITKNYSAIAERTMLPLFKAEGIGEISGGFITHMHMDHYGGAVSMIQNIQCRTIYTSGERTQGYAAYRLDSISQALHIPIIRVHQGDEITVEKDLHIYTLNPETMTEEVAVPLSSEGMNHHSLALKVVYKNSSALLLGDIEAGDEERLIKRYGDFLRCDIVKVAHHGSHTSSSEEFVKTAKPKYAVISVGKHNSFGHPAPSIVKRWIRSGASILRTDKEGAILFQSDGSSFRKVEWR